METRQRKTVWMTDEKKTNMPCKAQKRGHCTQETKEGYTRAKQVWPNKTFTEIETMFIIDEADKS